MNTKRNEISLVQLFWRVMLGWKIWLAAAVVLAVLFPAARYANNMRIYKAALQAAKQPAQETAFTEDEQAQIDNVLAQQKLLDKYNDYYDNAVLMNIDPYHESVLYLQYYVDSDYKINYSKDNENDYTTALANAYVSYSAYGLDEETVWSEAGADTEDRSLSGLITAETNVSANMAANTFYVRVIYSDADTLSAVSKYIQKQLSAKSDDFSDQIGSHKLVLISEDISEEADADLAAQQANVLSQITNCKNQITTLESTMTEAQLNAIAEEQTEEDETGDSTETAAAAVKPSVSVKDIVIGFLAGAFLAAALIACAFILSSKLQDTEELVTSFELREFAVLKRNEKASGLTALLIRLKNCRKKQLTPEAALGLTVSNIALCCKNEDINSVFLTGTEIERLDQSLISQITESLEKQGISVIYGENVCYDAAAMCKAAEAGHVVLMEIVDVSIYQEIEKEIRMLKDQNVKILGYIGVE